MPLTKAQKTKQIQDAAVELKKSRTLVFVDFTGTSVEGLRKLRADLRAEGATMKVVKKRLLKIALKEARSLRSGSFPLAMCFLPRWWAGCPLRFGCFSTYSLVGGRSLPLHNNN